jgi:hypothetical protein
VFGDDLVTEDVPRIVLMLVGTLISFEPGSAGQRRYLDLLSDMLIATRTALSPPTAVRDHEPNFAKLPISAYSIRGMR